MQDGHALLGRTAWVSLSLATTLNAGCAGWLSKPEPPDVVLTEVRLVKLSLTEPEFDFELWLDNPNQFTLRVRSVEFTVAVRGRNLARGRSDRAFEIPANGSSSVAIRVTGDVEGILQELYELSTGNGTDLGYQMHGTVRLDQWPFPVPFRVRGDLLTG